jgi:BASS family bile acid:Na+ symporter
MSDLISPFFICLTKLTLFSLILTLGFTVNLKQVVSLWQKPGLLNRAILGISVATPILAIVIGLGMDLSKEAKVGLVLVSISPGMSFPLHYLVKSFKGHLYTGALQTTTAFLSIMTIPLTLAIINEFMPADVRIAPFAVAQQLFVFQLLPLVIGILLQQFHLALLEQNAKRLTTGATVLLYALLIWALSQQFNTLLQSDMHSIVAIGLLAFISLWMGHWIGGREISTRTLLALTLTNHNIALALLIAVMNLPSIAVSPIIAIYVLISVGLEIAYSRWNQRRLEQH